MAAPIASNPSKHESHLILRQQILGSRRFSNYLWASVSTLGGAGFLLSSLSSYFGINLLPFSDPTQLVFIPQGIAMGFYGIAGLALGLYLWVLIALDVGGGYNEFDRTTGKATIFRWGFLGKDRQIELSYPLDDLQSIRVALKEGLNPKRSLYLKIKGRGEIPLTRVGQPHVSLRIGEQGGRIGAVLESAA
jgi:Ycf4